MNGFTWSAKGDLVPVCCRNAVGNTSPHVRRSRPLYYTAPARRTRDDPSRERKRERTSRPPLNYLVDSTKSACFCLSCQNDPDKPTIKTRGGSLRGRPVARVDSLTIRIYRESKRPRRWSWLDITSHSRRKRWLPTTQVHLTLTFAGQSMVSMVSITSRVMYRAFLILS